MDNKDLANAIRFLSIDAVQAAKSGHPGMPMGMADIAVSLWKNNLKHNPSNPKWINRDRFVLSNGHGSMLLYSLLHLTGYDLSINDLKDLSWPREVEAMNGIITIDDKPERILTISTGHDEMIFGFANLNNIVGVTMFSQSPGGNIYELTKDMPTISSEIETIIAQNPDICLLYTSPSPRDGIGSRMPSSA